MADVQVIKGTYQIIREIGSGSGGTVFLAYHTRLQKNVVLKKIKVDAKKLLNIRAEADILKNLHHLYLPQVFDFVEDTDEFGNEVIYTVMDFIPGKSFDDLLKEGQKFSNVQVAKYMRQLCEAVNYLHSQNPPIIHGDIKPANVMLTPDDNICLIDFNISGFSDSLEIIGFTKGYASPEQYDAAKINLKRAKQIRSTQPVEGQSSRTECNTCSDDNTILDDDRTVIDSNDDDVTMLDHSPSTENDDVTVLDSNPLPLRSSEFIQAVQIDRRADIYSIGATMYPLISGVKPNPEYEKQIPLAEQEISISEGLAYMIDRAMKLKPEERFQSTAEMLQAMDALGKKDKRYKRLIRRQIASCVILVFLAAACAVVSYMGYRRIQIEKADAFYANALNLYEAGEYEEDLSFILKDALHDESLYDRGMLGNLYYLAAECSFQTQEYQAAADFFKKSLIYNPKNQEAYCNYAISLAKLNQDQDAMDVINEAIDKGVAEDQIYLMKGELAATLGNIEEAETDFQTCISITQDSYVQSRAYIMYSDLFAQLENYENNRESIKSNITVLQDAKENVDDAYKPIVLERLANAYMQLADLPGENSAADYQIAIDTLNEEISMGWDSYDTYMNLAYLYNKVKQYENSYSTYQSLLEKYGDNYNVYKRLAFLEIDVQSEKNVNNRDYAMFESYYEKCMTLFEATGKQKDEDMELQLLSNAYDTLVDAGWIQN